jgi:hypothetical protein
MLINRVVDDLPDKVMQRGTVMNVSNVHTGTFTNRFQTLQHGDAAGAVVVWRILVFAIAQGGFQSVKKLLGYSCHMPLAQAGRVV